ncbi:MAG: three-Cys-motif partner protein TcmP [Clostridia bacterium]|nr:three-Cys-motif partner protein TcmP [Clostridia bacterium]
MASSNNRELISKASPHTVKKFELIEEYVKSWAQKLMLNQYCNGIVFIDCMCNSGLYNDENGALVEGTPIRVAKVLRDVAGQYPHKQVYLHFNDIDKDKTDLLQTKLPSSKENYHVSVTHEDGNVLLKDIGSRLDQRKRLHYFLLYDPYDASIDWEALFPFFRNWCEVMINHMVSDPVRAITQVKKRSTKIKYENTYLDAFENLVPFGSDKNAYEKRVEEIIEALKGQREYFVAAFPFYNSQNSQVYSLIHCTGNIEGFKLYKKCAWKTFGARSSTKNSHVDKDQLTMDFSGEGFVTTSTDESCFGITDIAKYLSRAFAGQVNVPLQTLWDLLDGHPIFPSDGYRKEIKNDLKNVFGATIGIYINPESGKRETVVTFLKGNPLI